MTRVEVWPVRPKGAVGSMGRPYGDLWVPSRQVAQPAGPTPRCCGMMRAGSHARPRRPRPDETFGWDKAAAKAELADELGAVAELQKRLFAEGERALLVVLQAMDAGGKDGVIRKVMTGINPAGVSTSPVVRRAERGGARPRLPVADPPAHCPSAAASACSTAATTRTCSSCASRGSSRSTAGGAATARSASSSGTLVEEGTAIVKLFLNVSKEEQRLRLQDRIDSPDERWKFRRRRPRRPGAVGRLHGRVPRRAAAPRRRRTRRGTSCPPTASGRATSPRPGSCVTPSSASTRSTRSRRRASRASS